MGYLDSKVLESLMIATEGIKNPNAKYIITDVNNNDILDENDFNVFITVIDDDSIPNDMKMNALIEFRKYNIMRTNKEVKVVSKVNIEDVRNCFIEHGFSAKQLRLVDKFKDEIYIE